MFSRNGGRGCAGLGRWVVKGGEDCVQSGYLFKKGFRILAGYNP